MHILKEIIKIQMKLISEIGFMAGITDGIRNL